MNVSLDAFGEMPDGSEVIAYTLQNRNGYVLRCMNYGATLIGFQAPDREGKIDEITLNYDSFDRYLAGHPFFGSTVGRVANRIGGSSFQLDGTTVRLEPNEGDNLLHSGPNGFHARTWGSEAFERGNQAGVLFSLESPDGDQGFPGVVSVTVALSLTDDNELFLEYHAESDRATPINLTNHCYWSLSGAPDLRRHRGEPVPAPEPRGGAIGEHILTINADEYVEVDEASIPTGRLIPVAGTPFDFTSPKPIGADLAQAGEYDHHYVLRRSAGTGEGAKAHADEDLRRAVMLRDPSTGRTMEILTTSPGVQFYSGNKLAATRDQFGEPFHKHDALCLETQYNPDAVNHENFPSIILQPSEDFRHKTVHRFGVE